MALGGRAPTGRHTFGLARAEVLAAFVNAQMLLVASGLILLEAWRRFRSPGADPHGADARGRRVGLVANVGAARLLHAGATRKSRHARRVPGGLHGRAGVARPSSWRRSSWRGRSGTGSTPCSRRRSRCSCCPGAFGILREAAHILLEGAPRRDRHSAPAAATLAVPGVEAVHDVHFWTLTSGLHSASVHIRASPGSARSEVLAGVQRVLREQGGVDHATIQIEQGGESLCHVAPEHA